MKLSKYFTLAEMTASITARMNGINNQPSDAVLANLRNFCTLFFDRVRDMLGVPISPTSGYRCFQLNMIVGGSVNSAHVEGEAADFTVKGKTPRQAIGEIVRSGIEFDQLIDEFGKWVHGSYSTRKPNRMQVMRATIVNGKKRYIFVTLDDAKKW